MKTLIFLLCLLPSLASALTLVVGDSQTGATWSKSYLGNFLAECLQDDYVMYGRGGTVPAQWMTQSNMDHIETMERTPTNHQHNIGPAKALPDYQKRISPMLDHYRPDRLILQFGGNMIGLTDAEITKQIQNLMSKIETVPCAFITPTYEMAVRDHRNVPSRNLTAVLHVNGLIKAAVADRCQVIDSVELMKNSPYFDGKELLKRVLIPGLPGCSGAAGNDNVHVCGEAARDWAQRVCNIIYSRK